MEGGLGSLQSVVIQLKHSLPYPQAKTNKQN